MLKNEHFNHHNERRDLKTCGYVARWRIAFCLSTSNDFVIDGYNFYAALDDFVVGIFGANSLDGQGKGDANQGTGGSCFHGHLSRGRRDVPSSR